MELNNNKHGNRTLLASLLLSAPGPLVLGFSLLMGSSTTQIADFVRRTVELAATFISWCVFRRVANLPKHHIDRIRLEHRVDISVGVAMLISGLAMGLVSIIGFMNSYEKGNVILALIIATLGAITNGILAMNYSIANKKAPNDVLKAQGTMYRTKTIVDFFVCAVLFIVMFSSQSTARIADFVGGLTVTIVLCINGVKLLLNRFTAKGYSSK